MTLTTTATVTSTAPGKVTLGVTSVPTLADSIQVFRVHADGSVHRVLTSAQPTITSSWADIDYHSPANQSVRYYAQTSTQTSAQSSPVVVPSTVLWLIHQSDPLLSMLATTWITNDAIAYKRADRSQKFQVLGSQLPVTRTDQPRGGESGTLTIKCATSAERAAVKNLLADNGPILINTPYTDDEIGWKWVQPGELTLSNPASYTTFPYRYAQFPYEEVQQPDSDITSHWTYANLASTYATYATLKTAYAAKTYRELKLNV